MSEMPSTPETEAAAVDRAYAALRGHTKGEFRFDEHLRPFKFVIGPDGRLVGSVMVAMLQAVDTVLFIPTAEEGALEVQVTLMPFEESEHGRLVDRHQIYHGPPDDVQWAFLDIDAAKFEGAVIDGEAITRPNPLADQEARICKHMNKEHREDLQKVCVQLAEVGIEEPVMVGVDPLGFDIRGRFEVYRINAPEPMVTGADVRRVLIAMCNQPS